MKSLYYDEYPKDLEANLEWRIRCRERCLEDEEFREAFWQAGMEDPLFFFASCLAKGTMVVTDRGPVPIEDVVAADKVWDGMEWVFQEGALYQGHKRTILAYSSKITPDHKVWTNHGWKDASEGFNRADVRLPNGYSSRWDLPEYEAGSVALSMSVRKTNARVRQLSSPRSNEELWLPQSRDKTSREVVQPNSQHMAEHAPKVQKSKRCSVSRLWWAWDQSMRAVGYIREFPRRHGRKARRSDVGSDRQRGRLFSRELSMGYLVATSEKYSAKHKVQNIQGSVLSHGISGSSWDDNGSYKIPHQAWVNRGSATCTREAEILPVFDLLNCGPRRAFTILDANGRPLLVHNCLWVYEPRSERKVKPMIPWPHQESLILTMDETITEALSTEQPISLTVKKSRAQGGTYVYLGVQIRRALKESHFSSGLVTRNEELVDSRSNSSAVMHKLAWMLDRLPEWGLSEYQRNTTEHTIVLPNGSFWAGYAATGDVARGGRLTMFAFDEPGSEEFVAGSKDFKILSSVSHVANCLFLVSTFGVDSGVFYESATDPDNPRVYTLDWKDNPEHSKLGYIVRDGDVQALRPEEQKAVEAYRSSHERELRSIARRGHMMENKVRSPWYDSHCLLPGGTPRYIARELDMDPRGAVGKVFNGDLLDRVKRETCQPPVWQGTPVFDGESLLLKGLLTRDDGPLKLWFRPGPDFSCPLGPFTVGCDVAIGSDGAYSSNSVASGIDNRTGEQVLEYAVRGMPMIKFGRNVVGLCLWLRRALLGWEDSGMVGPFAKEIMEVLYYGNVYYRDVAEVGTRRKTRKAGWWNGRDEHKADLFEKMALGMETGSYIIRSEELIRECGEYEWEKGKIIHQPTKNQGATEKAHGDRTIAGGVAYLLYSEGLESSEHLDTGDETGQTPEYGSFLWCEQQERSRVNSDSPDFGLQDVVGY